MITEADIDRLRSELERLRDAYVQGQLDDQRLWRLMQAANDLSLQAAGSPLGPTVQVVCRLLQAMWTTTRQQGRLDRMSQALPSTRAAPVAG